MLGFGNLWSLTKKIGATISNPKNLLDICGFGISAVANYFFSAEWPFFTAILTSTSVVVLSVSCAYQTYGKYRELAYIKIKLNELDKILGLNMVGLGAVTTAIAVGLLTGYNLCVFFEFPYYINFSAAVLTVIVPPAFKKTVDAVLRVKINTHYRGIIRELPQNLNIIQEPKLIDTLLLLKDMLRERTRLEGTIASLQDRLQERESSLGQPQHDLNVSEEIASLQTQIEEKQNALELQASQLETAHNFLDKLQTKIATLRTQIEEKENKLGRQASQLKAAQNALDESQTKVASLQDQIEEKQNELELQASQLEVAQNALHEAQAKVVTLQAQIEQKEVASMESQAELTRLRAQIAAKEAETSQNTSRPHRNNSVIVQPSAFWRNDDNNEEIYSNQEDPRTDERPKLE